MRRQDFLNDVMHEIDMLKKHGTNEELARLNFNTFSYDSFSGCIYGQMTGVCSSERAKVLMDKSCIRVMNIQPNEKNLSIRQSNFTKVKEWINGENTGQGWNVYDDFQTRNYRHLSALEGYICLKGSKNKQIIKYLRGEQETLKL
jgi:hypothetical protein